MSQIHFSFDLRSSLGKKKFWLKTCLYKKLSFSTSRPLSPSRSLLPNPLQSEYPSAPYLKLRVFNRDFGYGKVINFLKKEGLMLEGMGNLVIEILLKYAKEKKSLELIYRED